MRDPREVHGEIRELVVADILRPQADDVVAKPHSALTFSSQYVRRAHMAVRKAGLAGLITFHTHPLADLEVGFCWYDDEQDPLLVENLQELWPGTLLSSIVLGERAQFGRLWTSPSEQSALGSLVNVGERLQYLSLNGKRPEAPPAPSEIFDRALALTGGASPPRHVHSGGRGGKRHRLAHR